MTSESRAAASSSIDQRFRLFVAGVTDYAIYMLSPEGIVSSWNAGAQRFKGYTADEIIGQHFSRFYSAADQADDVPAHALQTALREGKFEDEGWRIRKDGSRFWASVVIDPIRDESGELVGYAKITRDITERKRAAEALHASEENFRLLVQGVTDYAIYMLSPTGLVTNWNAGAERIKGYTEAEVINTHFSRFYTPEDVASGLPALALAEAESKGRFEREGVRVRKDGSRFAAHVVIDPIRNHFGELVGFAKVTRDITERQNAAMALEKTREALFQSQKLEAIGKLTGGVAHDFNNLLSVMSNGVSILQQRLRNPEDVRVLDAMARAASRGATLTQQLLTFARQQPLDQSNHDLNDLIVSFEVVLRRAVDKAIAFDAELAPDLPLVLVDGPQVEAAILNLIVNARDATQEGGAISLATRRVVLAAGAVEGLEAGSYAAVSVKDTGHGMSPETARRAVEPFFTTKPVGQGTGLGLSQIYGLIQQSGGGLTIDSELDKGTTVTLYFPALPDSAATGAAAEKPSEVALVVDDQQDVLDMASELFRAMGYQVLAASNGADALQILKRTPKIDVLFSDVVMPGMTGIELAQQAREHAPEMKILLASGYTAPALASAQEAVSGFEFVRKPYTVSQILKQLRSAG